MKPIQLELLLMQTLKSKTVPYPFQKVYLEEGHFIKFESKSGHILAFDAMLKNVKDIPEYQLLVELETMEYRGDFHPALIEVEIGNACVVIDLSIMKVLEIKSLK